MITYNSITSIQAHNLLRPIFNEENTYSAHWAPSLATPPKADDQKENETPFRTNKLNMSEGEPNLNSSNTHTVAHGNFILKAFVIVVFAPGCGPNDFERMSFASFLLLWIVSFFIQRL